MTSAPTILSAWLGLLRQARETVIDLGPDATVALIPRSGASLSVAGGQAWVTQAGDARDHLPEAGTTMTLAAHGLVVVQNLAKQPITLRCKGLRRAG